MEPGMMSFLLQIWNKLEPQNSFKIAWIFSRFFVGESGDVSMLLEDFFHENKKHVFSARLRYTSGEPHSGSCNACHQARRGT